MTTSTTCKCCFDNVHEYISCSRGHAICKECVVGGVNNAIGQRKVFACVDQSECKGKYFYNKLFIFIKDKRIQKAYKELKKPLEPLKQLDNVIVAKCEERDPYIIYCCLPMVLNDACNKITCPKCYKKWCWYCKKEIAPEIYFRDHYKVEIYTSDIQKNVCPLYGYPSS